MDEKDVLSRREAVAKLAKLSAYTAPSVIALLSVSSSYAAGSCLPGVEDQPRVRGDRKRRGRTNDTDATTGDRRGPPRDTAEDCVV